MSLRRGSTSSGGPPWRGRLALAFLLAAWLVPGAPAWAQQLQIGHKVLGSLGLEAGSQPEPGLYLAGRGIFYSAGELKDRNGNDIPVGLDLNAFAGAFGIGGVVKVSPLSTYLSASVAGPIAHVSVSTERPEASIDRFGLGDLYVQPLRLGWRFSRGDVVVGYAFYAPTGRTEPGGIGGIGRGQWTHEFSAGGTVWFDRGRTWNLSALASYELNGRKIAIDITRGDTVQIQGGAGKRVSGFVEVGLAGYALWQVSDDRGSQLPPALSGARDRVYGLGPEIDVILAPIRTRLTLRYEHDFGTRSRPQGQILVAGVTIGAFVGERSR